MRAKLWSWLGPVLLFGVSMAVYYLLKTNPHLNIDLKHTTGHFYIVSTVSMLAVIVSVAVGVAGIKLRNVNVTFLSLAFISLAGLFTVHGLSTPGFMVHDVTVLPVLAAQLSVVVAAVWICLSALPTDSAIVRWLARRQRMLVSVWVIALPAAGVLLIQNIDTLERALSDLGQYKWIAALITSVCCLFAMVRYRESYVLTRFPFHLGIIYSCSLLIVSEIIMVTGEVWQLSWWLYHFTLLASMLFMVGGVIMQYVAQPSIGGLFNALFRPNPRAMIASSISPSVRSLIGQTEQKDAYTAGHNYRVALYALRLAEHMGVQARLLRAMAQGCIVHDVGKLYTPDNILNKPGKLTPEERAVIELHPVYGYDLCKRLGFMAEELAIIRSHHERWDGTGYPDRLRGEEIPLLARITAVADVYDALTSSRAYRAAMSHDEAMTIIVQQRGRHFDPKCVDALVSLTEADPEFFRSMHGEGTAAAVNGMMTSSPSVSG